MGLVVYIGGRCFTLAFRSVLNPFGSKKPRRCVGPSHLTSARKTRLCNCAKHGRSANVNDSTTGTPLRVGRPSRSVRRGRRNSQSWSASQTDKAMKGMPRRTCLRPSTHIVAHTWQSCSSPRVSGAVPASPQRWVCPTCHWSRPLEQAFQAEVPGGAFAKAH